MNNQFKSTLNDLPKYSPWPARLLGLESCEQKHKTQKEIIREFEYEKWGSLLEKVRESKKDISVKEVDEWVLKDAPATLCSIEDRFELLSPCDAHLRYINLVDDVLKSYLPATSLIELGAGYGSIILALAKKNPFTQMRIMAGEYTSSGIELIKYLAQVQHLQIEVGQCDFTSPTITDLAIPENAIIFTSYATHYVPKLSANFVKVLSSFNPRVVIHFEPCYEHCNNDTLLGLMRRRYIKVNDYNVNLITLLRDQQKLGMVTILDERWTVFGKNPLLAASVIVWAPQDRGAIEGIRANINKS